MRDHTFAPVFIKCFLNVPFQPTVMSSFYKLVHFYSYKLPCIVILIFKIIVCLTIMFSLLSYNVNIYLFIYLIKSSVSHLFIYLSSFIALRHSMTCLRNVSIFGFSDRMLKFILFCLFDSSFSGTFADASSSLLAFIVY